MRTLLIIISVTIAFTSSGQYVFEKYPAIKYKEYSKWKYSLDNTKQNVLLITPKFFDNKESLSIQLVSFMSGDSSYIILFKGKKEFQRLLEPIEFTPVVSELPLRVADINGDHLEDLKLIVPYMGTGLAAMNVRVIYLFQQKNHTFIKVSYDDKMGEKTAWENRPERDFDGDGNYEIITQTLQKYQDHNYWLFNLFNFSNNDLTSVNSKFNYPILIQFLYRDNYKITNKLSRKQMKAFALKKPEEYDKRL